MRKIAAGVLLFAGCIQPASASAAQKTTELASPSEVLTKGVKQNNYI